ncbi:MAG: AbrB/MazE/SpoVT family DNA-binding domain-containing protein [Nitrososphaerales archaeon]
MTSNENEKQTPEYMFKKTLKKGTEAQAEFVKRMASMQFDAMQGFLGLLQTLTNFNAVFKATVQSNGRISIPEAEREALGIADGDLVQVIIVPLEKGAKGRSG